MLEYIGRYTHKVAISDYRILAIDQGQVTFRYRDRADGDKEKTMALPAETFIQRFLLHILPPGMQKIRFCGWMGRNVRRQNLRDIRQAIGIPPPERDPDPACVQPTCPCCGQSALIRVLSLAQPRAPPDCT